MEYKQRLTDMINRLLDGSLSVPEFHSEYYEYYLDGPDDALTDGEADYFGTIQQKLDFAGEFPNAIERKEGWMDYEGYVQMVRDLTEQYLKSSEEN